MADIELQKFLITCVLTPFYRIAAIFIQEIIQEINTQYILAKSNLKC